MTSRLSKIRLSREWRATMSVAVIFGLATSIPVSTAIATHLAAAATAQNNVPGAPADGQILPSLNTPNSTTWAEPNGSRQVTITASPYQWETSAGNWEPIDNTLVAATGGGYQNKSNSFTVTLPATAGGALVVSSNTSSMSLKLKGTNAVDASVSGSTAVYSSALTDTDVHYDVTSNDMDETDVLNSASAPSNFMWNLSTKDLTPEAQRDGSINLYGPNNKLAFTIEAPSVKDAAGIVGPATMSLLGGDQVSVTIDPSWLKAPGRAFPVTLDPTVSVNPSWGCQILEASPADYNCGSADYAVGESATGAAQRLVTEFYPGSIPSYAGVTSATMGFYETAVTGSGWNLGVYPINTYGGTGGYEYNETSWSDCYDTPCSQLGWVPGGDFISSAPYNGSGSSEPVVSANNWVLFHPLAAVQQMVNGTYGDQFEVMATNESSNPGLATLDMTYDSHQAYLTFNYTITTVTGVALSSANLLTANDSYFAGSVGTWGGGTGETSVVLSPNVHLYGQNSLLVTMAAAAGTNQWINQANGGSSQYLSVSPSTAINGMVSVYSPVATTMWLDIRTYTSGGTYIADNDGSSVNVPADSWTELPEGFTTSSTAALASLRVYDNTTVPYQQFYLDQAGLFPGSLSAWTGVGEESGIPLGGGTSISITGTNFNGSNLVTGVSFGSVAATSFTVNSATSITAVAPANSAGLADVTVTNSLGTSPDTPVDQVLYEGTPTISALTPSSGRIEGGTDITVTGTNLSELTALSVGTVPAASFTEVSSTSVAVVTPAETGGTINVTASTIGGSSTGSPYTYSAPTSPSSQQLAMWVGGNTTSSQEKVQPITLSGSPATYSAGSGSVIDTGNTLTSFSAPSSGATAVATASTGNDTTLAYYMKWPFTSTTRLTNANFANLDGSAVLPDDKYAFLADEGFETIGGALDVISLTGTPSLASNIQNPDGASGLTRIAACPNGNTVVASDDQDNEVLVFTLSGGSATPTNPSVASVSGSGISDPTGITCVGSTAYVTDTGSGKVSVISLSGTPSVTGSINVGSGPDAVVATAGNLFVANGSDGTVSVVNLATGSPVSGSPVTVGSNPDAVGVAGDVFVANKGSNSISILNPTNGSVLQTVGSVQSPVSLSVGIAPGSSATSALSIAESLGLSNPAEACSGCLQSEDVSQLEDEAYVGDEADISGETDEALALDAMGGFPINTANGNFTYALPAITDPGLGAPLTAQLTYNSYNSKSNLSGSVLGSPDVGYNWTAGPGLTLANNVPTTGSVTITQENGSQVVFTQPTSTSPTFVCPGDEVAIDQVSTAYCAEPRVQAMLFRNSDGTWTFDRFPKSYESFTFSSSGVLTKMADGSGNTTTVTTLSPGTSPCPSSGVSSCVEYEAPSGRYLLFEENSSNQVTKVTDSVHNLTLTYCTTTTSSCATGDLQTAALSSASVSDNSDSTSHTWSFGYDETNSLNALNAVQDPNATVGSYSYITNTYDDSSTSDPTFGWATQQQVAITSSTSSTTTFNYSGLGPSPASGNGSVIVTDPNGNQTLYGYSGSALVSKTTGYNSNSAATSLYERDPTTFMDTETIDPNGHVSQYGVDQYGRMTTYQDGSGNVISYTYNGFTLSGGGINPGAMEPFEVDNASGTSSVDNTYNNDGTLSVQAIHPDYPVDNPANDVTTDYYYASSGNGELIGIQDPLGRGKLYGYDSAGDVTQSWVVPSYSLDHASPSASMTELDTCTTYDAVGRVETVVPPDGNVGSGGSCATSSSYTTRTNTYNALDEPTEVTHPPYSGSSADQTLDTYDPDGHLTVVEENAPSSTTYTTKTYDRAGWLCWTDPASSSNACSSPPSGATSYGYDADGNATSVEDGSGNTTTNQFIDPAYPNAVTKTIKPDGTNATISTYDPAGNLASTTDPMGQTVSYAYDANERLCVKYAGSSSGLTCSSPPTGSISYTYNADSQRVSMADQSGRTDYTLDTLGRTEAILDGNMNTVSYGYNADNEVTCLGYPDEGAALCPTSGSASGSGQVGYTYDGDGRTTSVTDWLGNSTSYTYDANSNVTQIAYTGATTTLGYNDDNTLTSESITNYGLGTTTEQWVANGQELATSYTLNSGSPESFTYDGQNRVTGTSGAYYGYSPSGELCWINSTASSNSCSSPPSGSTQLTYNSDSEVTSGSWNYGYNADGERCWTATGTSSSCSTAPSGTIFGYGWNAFGELCSVVSGAAASGCSSGVTYTYNGDGLRMQSKNGSATDFSWDPLSNPATPHILTDGTNAYIYGPDVFSGESAPIEQISLGESPTISNLNSDPMGVRQIFNLGGSIQIVYSYNGSSIGAYGNYSTTSYWGGISTPFRYKGGYEDSYYQEYFVNRYYDLYSGQFLSVDPLVAQTNQPYTYTN